VRHDNQGEDVALATATDGVTDPGKLHSVAIEEGLCRAD
jgi:hypothetical protein